jgi:DNA-binding beta-propeller fold protein YncE
VIESYHDSLLVFSPSGEFLLPIGGSGAPGGNFYLPSGVWVDAKNQVYVADMFNGRIVRFQFLGGG